MQARIVPSVKKPNCLFLEQPTKVFLQHDWTSVLLLLPARDFEQWEHGLRLSDKPQGKHIVLSYCLSLCCVVLHGSSITCPLIPLLLKGSCEVHAKLYNTWEQSCWPRTSAKDNLNYLPASKNLISLWQILLFFFTADTTSPDLNFQT